MKAAGVRRKPADAWKIQKAGYVRKDATPKAGGAVLLLRNDINRPNVS